MNLNLENFHENSYDSKIQIKFDVLEIYINFYSEKNVQKQCFLKNNQYPKELKKIDLDRALLRSMEYNLKNILKIYGNEIGKGYMVAKKIFEESKDSGTVIPDKWLKYCNNLNVPSSIFREFLPRIYEGDFEFEKMSENFIIDGQ